MHTAAPSLDRDAFRVLRRSTTPLTRCGKATLDREPLERIEARRTSTPIKKTASRILTHSEPVSTGKRRDSGTVAKPWPGKAPTGTEAQAEEPPKKFQDGNVEPKVGLSPGSPRRAGRSQRFGPGFSRIWTRAGAGTGSHGAIPPGLGQGLTGGFNQLAESLGVAHGDVGKDLPVQLQPRLPQAVN